MSEFALALDHQIAYDLFEQSSMSSQASPGARSNREQQLTDRNVGVALEGPNKPAPGFSGAVTSGPVSLQNLPSTALTGTQPAHPPTIKGLGAMPAAFPQTLDEGAQGWKDRFSNRKIKFDVQDSKETQRSQVDQIEKDWVFWVTQLYGAICAGPVAPKQYQKDAVEDLQKKLKILVEDSDLNDLALQLASQILKTTIDTHRDGSTLWRYEILPITATGAPKLIKKDLEMNIKDRLQVICLALRQQNRIDLDCFTDDRAIDRLVFRPSVYQLMKEKHDKSNGRKADRTADLRDKAGLKSGRKRKAAE